ncbi:RcnB family protein [Sphingomonas sp. ASY06-1R]|uniref:RcnB family protein n=1 Tax=Sphingomonas sp. ASY06-1R TaxID=3445771 RepID=UPI003FA2EE64
MRMAILAGLMAATIAPTMAQAQTGELRHDRREVREQQRDVQRAIRNGDSPREIREQRQDVRQARREYRDDWREYRSRNPNIYRGGRWDGPRGYRYRPINAGHRFDRAFYERRYWVDPYRYHLRPVLGWQRWVRYGNDVALVDVRSGRVLEVNRRFFF